MPRIPSRAKSLQLVNDYINGLQDFWKQHRDDPALARTTIENSHAAQRKIVLRLDIADLADVYLDEKRHEEWIDAHKKHLEAQLRLQLDNVNPSEAFLDRVGKKEGEIRQRLGPHTATRPQHAAQDTAETQVMLGKVQHLLDLFPEVRARLLDPTAVQRGFGQRMDKVMETFRTYLLDEGAKDLKLQLYDKLDWDSIVGNAEAQVAPRHAHESMVELEEAKKESKRLRLENERLSSENESLQSSLDSVQRQVQGEVSNRQQAQRQPGDGWFDIQEAIIKEYEQETEIAKLKTSLFDAEQTAWSERQRFDREKAQLTRDLVAAQQSLAAEAIKVNSLTGELAEAKQNHESTTAEVRRLQTRLDTEQAEHGRKKVLKVEVDGKFADAKQSHQSTKAAVDLLEKDVEDQQQAVATFAKYCLGVPSTIALPSVKEMQTLQSERYGQPVLEDSTGLPAIVIASGQLPAAWSYLSFASGGVSLNSRFNQASISPTVSSELSWIYDTLTRVVNAVSDETMTAELRRTMIVVLQGIAYVHLATRLWMNTSLRPDNLLASLAHIERGDGSVLGMVHQQVYDLVHHGNRFTSWVRDGFTGEQLNATNSRLPQDVALIHRETPGTVFLRCSAGLFILEDLELGFDIGFMTAKLYLPAGIPNNLRQLDLAATEHMEALNWALGARKC